MKIEDKRLVSLTVPPGRDIIIIFRGTNKNSKAKNKPVFCPLNTRIIVTFVVILNIRDFETKKKNHGEIAQF